MFFTAENPSESLEILAREHDCQSVLLEAGGRLNAAFLEAGLVDELALFYAPMVTGGSVPALAGRGARSVSEAWGISNPECEAIGNDFFVRGALTTRKSAAKHISRG